MLPHRLAYYRQTARRGSRNAQRVVDAFNPDQPREADGKWGEGGGTPRTAREAATQIARHVTVEMGNKPSFPGKAKIRKNWENNFTPGHFALSAEQFDQVDKSVKAVMGSPLMRGPIEKFGIPPVLLLAKNREGQTPEEAGEHNTFGPAIVVHPSSLVTISGPEQLSAGMSVSGMAGERLPSVILHEYGHHIYGKMSTEEKRAISEAMPRDIGKALTKYAEKNDDEAHAELFTVAVHPDFKSENFPALGHALRTARKIWGMP